MRKSFHAETRRSTTGGQRVPRRELRRTPRARHRARHRARRPRFPRHPRPCPAPRLPLRPQLLGGAAAAVGGRLGVWGGVSPGGKMAEGLRPAEGSGAPRAPALTCQPQPGRRAGRGRAENDGGKEEDEGGRGNGDEPGAALRQRRASVARSPPGDIRRRAEAAPAGRHGDGPLLAATRASPRPGGSETPPAQGSVPEVANPLCCI